ncbi:MAG TPA: hypothetical protein DDZ99_09475 [Clostridiales bacterium]|nr:hypothetical protein [Clostridiales bacterium]
MWSKCSPPKASATEKLWSAKAREQFSFAVIVTLIQTEIKRFQKYIGGQILHRCKQRNSARSNETDNQSYQALQN